MNPYLRISKKPGPTLYFYTKEVLGQWPELEPASATPPVITAKVIDAFEGFTAKQTNLPMWITIEVLFDNEFMFSLGSQKWFEIIDDVFEWAPFTTEYYPSPHHDIAPEGLLKYGNPELIWSDNLLKVHHPVSFQDTLDDILLEMFNEKYLWLRVDKETAEEIRRVVEAAYSEWEPAFPEINTSREASKVARVLASQATNKKVIFCPESSTSQKVGSAAKVAYALIVDPEDGAISPLFTVEKLVTGSSSGKIPELYFTSEEAVSAALNLCGAGVTTMAFTKEQIAAEIEMIDADVTRIIEKYQAKQK